MKLFLKSKARYGLLMFALSGVFGSVVAQQHDTIAPPPVTNPNNRTLPNTGNPADTMRTPEPLPPEGRTIRPDSIRLDRPTHRPGMRRDSMEDRRMMPSEGGTMPPNDLRRDSGMMPNDKKVNRPHQGVHLDSLHQPTMTHDGRTMTKAQRDSLDRNTMRDKNKSTTDGRTMTKAQRDSLDRSKMMDKNKAGASGTKPKAKAGKKKPSSAATPRTEAAPRTIDKTGVKPVIPDSTQPPVPKPRSNGGN